MQLTWCESFVAVVDYGGFSAAARATHRSQSRVSAHVAALETFLDARLLDRTALPPVLTAAGAAFLPNARATVAAFAAGHASVTQLVGTLSGTLAVGSFPAASIRILTPALVRLRNEFDGVGVTIREGASRWLEGALGSSLVELAIRPMRPRPLREVFDSLTLTPDPFVAVMPADHELAGPRLAIERLAGYPVITTGEAESDRRVGAEYAELLAATDVDLRQSMTVGQPMTMAALVRARFGVGMIGAMAASTISREGLAVVPLDTTAPVRMIGVFWLRGRILSPVAERFLQLLRETYPADSV